MQIPLEITWRGVEKTEALDRLIQERTRRLERVHRRLTSCRVALERPHHSQKTGHSYSVRITLRFPTNQEVVVRREATGREQPESLVQLVHDAFDTARRQLRDTLARQRGEVKTHPQQEKIGYVVRLFPDDDYGFLRTIEGREVYFHRHSVLNDDFDRIEIGTGMRYSAELGDEGLQAATVEIVDKPGVRAGKVSGSFLPAPVDRRRQKER